MSHFDYRNGTLCVDGISLTDIAQEYGTPLYVYSAAAIAESYNAYAAACGKHEGNSHSSLICYSVKSNSNLAVLKLLSQLGSGFDIVSGGELMRVIAAGGNPKKVIFSGVGKTAEEIRLALSHGILCFNVESMGELQRIDRVAGEMGVHAPVSFRVNPDVDARTHPYISTGLKENKFGVAFEDALECYRTAAALPHIDVIGIDCHIGSQLLDDAPLLEALDKLMDLVDVLEAEGIHLHHLDIGGGIGITYRDEQPVAIGDYLERLFAKIHPWRSKKYAGKPIQMIFEPGRSIVGNAGVLLAEVQYLKEGEEKHFVIVDAAMNDLMRPAMYQAWHNLLPVAHRDTSPRTYDVVGPICESGDWLARQRELSVEEGDLLAFMSAGAYGMTMSSNYNTRPRAAEVLVKDGRAHLVRRRETTADLYALESVLP